MANRRVSITVILALAGVGLGLAPSANAANVAKGKRLFDSQCAACHSVKPGDNGIGPSLAGVYGAKAGQVKGYHFSSAMKHSGVTWNQKTLAKFIANPSGVVPGTKMPYMGMPGQKNRADVVAYLKTLNK